MSYAKKMRQYFREYEAEGNPMPADLNDVYEWARRTGRWTPPVELARRAFVEDMSRALREDYFTDDNGLRVRAMHPAVVKRDGAQYHLWHDARKANHEHMAAAFTGRRNGVVGDLKQLKTDVDWYNLNRPGFDGGSQLCEIWEHDERQRGPRARQQALFG